MLTMAGLIVNEVDVKKIKQQMRLNLYMDFLNIMYNRSKNRHGIIKYQNESNINEKAEIKK